MDVLLLSLYLLHPSSKQYFTILFAHSGVIVNLFLM